MDGTGYDISGSHHWVRMGRGKKKEKKAKKSKKDKKDKKKKAPGLPEPRGTDGQRILVPIEFRCMRFWRYRATRLCSRACKVFGPIIPLAVSGRS